MSPGSNSSSNQQDMSHYLIFSDYNPELSQTMNSHMSNHNILLNRSKEMDKPKGRRVSLSEDEKRAEHNAIERARRECLNYKFRVLAKALPNLQNFRRPSKGQIVEKALEWVKQALYNEDQYQRKIMQLENENKRLRMQIQNTRLCQPSQPTAAAAAAAATVPPSVNDSSLLPDASLININWTQQNAPIMTPSSSTPILSGCEEDISNSSSPSIDDLNLLLQDFSQDIMKNTDLFVLENSSPHNKNFSHPAFSYCI